MVGCCLGSRVDYFYLALVDCWGQASWDGFVVRTLVPMEWVERARGLAQVVLAMHSRFVGVVVPQMWEFSPHTTVLAKTWSKPAVVA